jgi:hypothetical protein
VKAFLEYSLLLGIRLLKLAIPEIYEHMLLNGYGIILIFLTKNFLNTTSQNGFEKFILWLQEKLMKILILISHKLKNFRKIWKIEMKSSLLYGKKLELYV